MAQPACLIVCALPKLYSMERQTLVRVKQALCTVGWCHGVTSQTAPIGGMSAGHLQGSGGGGGGGGRRGPPRRPPLCFLPPPLGWK